MKSIGILIFIMLLCMGCSNQEALLSEYEMKIEKQNIEIDKLKEELQQIKGEYHSLEKNRVDLSFLQVFNLKARTIIRLIDKQNFDKLRSEYNVDFEVTDERYTLCTKISIIFLLILQGYRCISLLQPTTRIY